MIVVSGATGGAQLIVDARCELGESPLWDHRQEVVVWVDILSGELHSWSPVSQAHQLLVLRLAAILGHARPGSH